MIFHSDIYASTICIGQEFARTTTQSHFAGFGIFLFGIALLMYGLRLTLRATDKQTSRYFKAMI